MVILATFGTSDSGKTTLIEGLTKTVMQKYQTEKNRAITLKVNYSSYTVDGKNRYFLDLPGHKTFVLQTIRNINNIDLALYVIDCSSFKNLQKRKNVLKHYHQYRSLFKFINLNHILIFNKAETITKEELVEYYKILLKQKNTGCVVAQPVCALDDCSLENLKSQIEVALADERSLKVKTKIQDLACFKTIKSFDVNLPGRWLTSITGGVLGGLRTKTIEASEELYYYDKLLSCWNKIFVKGLKTESDPIITIETLSDPYFFKNDQFKGVLFFKKQDVMAAQQKYHDDLKIKVTIPFIQPVRETNLHVVIDGQIARAVVRNFKNNILTAHLKKQSGLIYCPANSKVILLQDVNVGIQKMEFLGLGQIKN